MYFTSNTGIHTQFQKPKYYLSNFTDFNGRSLNVSLTLLMKNDCKIKESAKTKIQQFRMATEKAFKKCPLLHTKG